MKQAVKWAYQNMLCIGYSPIAIKNGRMYVIVQGGLECELLTFDRNSMGFVIKHWAKNDH